MSLAPPGQHPLTEHPQSKGLLSLQVGIFRRAFHATPWRRHDDMKNISWSYSVLVVLSLSTADYEDEEDDKDDFHRSRTCRVSAPWAMEIPFHRRELWKNWG